MEGNWIELLVRLIMEEFPGCLPNQVAVFFVLLILAGTVAPLFFKLRVIRRLHTLRSHWHFKRREKHWFKESNAYGSFNLFYQEFLPLEERLRWRPFKSRKHQRRGYRVFRDDGKVFMEPFWEAYEEASVRAQARRKALLRNHEFSREAKACGFKDLDEVIVLMFLTDLYRLLPKADQLALRELINRLLTSREKSQFLRALDFYDSNIKQKDLSYLDTRTRWILLREFKISVEGSREKHRETQRSESEIVEFLRRLSTKKKGEKVPTIYEGNVRIAFILVGRPEVVQRHGARPYVDYINSLSNENIDRVYILAKGPANIRVAQEVVARTRSLFRKIEQFPPDITKEMAVCFCLQGQNVGPGNPSNTEP